MEHSHLNIPPLPELAMSDYRAKQCPQEIVDKSLSIIYERRPDLFLKMMEREKTESDPENATREAVFAYIREVVKAEANMPPGLNAMFTVFWEMRRRARLMAGLYI